jgi:radical SAM protein with 4Fe4S-binding SPASM domain
LTHESGAFGSKAEARALVQEAQQLAQAKHIGIVYNAVYRLRWEIGEIPLAEGPQLRSDYTAADLRRLGMRKACGVPWAHVVIGDNGDVHPCCASDRVMGNVTRQPFEEIWFGQPYDDFRRRMLSTDPPPECLRCQRAAWQPLQKLSDLRSSLVHRHEVHGQGWGEEFLASDGVWYRHMGKSSTFFLRYRREAFLHMKLGTFTPEPIVGQVIVNDVVVGDFHVQEQQQHVTCRLPRLKGPVIRVTLTGQPADYKLVMYESVLSRLGQPWYRRFSPSVKWNLLKPRG